MPFDRLPDSGLRALRCFLNAHNIPGGGIVELCKKRLPIRGAHSADVPRQNFPGRSGFTPRESVLHALLACCRGRRRARRAGGRAGARRRRGVLLVTRSRRDPGQLFPLDLATISSAYQPGLEFQPGLLQFLQQQRKKHFSPRCAHTTEL
eukprot:11918277-Alexandrium_andersonii.AAC.1